MKITGIIAEYNPFHNGHRYQIQKARQITGADYIIVVMSGNFTQRGTPALIDKYSRAKMALMGGADLVLELPVCFATGSAEYFASGAIALLNQLGCVDAICFGSECGDIIPLKNVAQALVNETDDYKKILKSKLKNGSTYPVARNAALAETMDGFIPYDMILGFPNNILGIEYIKALIRQNSSIEPFTNQRIGSDYHSYRLAETFSSAISIRQSLFMKDDLELVRPQLPSATYQVMEDDFHKTFPVFDADFSSMLKFKLLLEREKGFTEYMDVTKAISDKLVRNTFKMQEFDEFCDLLKTKDVTYARISRCLSHILLDIYAEEVAQYMDSNIVFYARALGFNENAAPLSRAIKKNASIPLITKTTSAPANLYPLGRKQFEHDVHAAHIYECIAGTKYHAGMRDEYRRQMVKIQ
ncbi:MAG: nucleotidyltransferase [Lachnospiraceae bacterium]|nr:nucleotidyltransferase [Lachnospiraceae bacterium]